MNVAQVGENLTYLRDKVTPGPRDVSMVKKTMRNGIQNVYALGGYFSPAGADGQVQLSTRGAESRAQGRSASDQNGAGEQDSAGDSQDGNEKRKL